MPSSGRYLKCILAFWLWATAGCFAPSRIQRIPQLMRPAVKLPSVARSPPKPRSLQIHVDATPRPTGDNKRKGLFGRWKRRFSVGRFFQKSLRRFRFSRKNRHRFAALVFASCLWLRGGLPPPVAHANDAPEATPIERVVESPWMVSGGSDEVATTSADTSADEESAVDVAPTTAGEVTNGKKLTKALIGAAVLIPSAGIMYSRFQGDEQSAVDSDKEKTDGGEDGEKKDGMMKRVLERASKSRLKVDADTYLKSVQKEKNLISSALNKLNKQIESAAEADEKAARRASAAQPISASSLHGTDETALAMATNAELPLMSPKYVQARQQPKSIAEEQMLSEKYSKITDLSEKCFVILVDLGMIEVSEDIEEKTLMMTTSTVPAFGEEEEPFQ